MDPIDEVAATTARSRIPTLDLLDLWDWSYCPMRVWWRKAGAESDGSFKGAQVGEALVRRSVQRVIKLYYEAAWEDSAGPSPHQAFGLVWRGWLQEWGIDDGVADDLLRYHEERSAILHRFSPDGDLRRTDGTRYLRPTWTRAWKDLAKARGLHELERKIQQAAQEAGIPRPDLPDDGGIAPVIGLAEAFSVALTIVDGLHDLPDPNTVLAVAAPASVELLSARLKCRVDLILDLGERALRGRPPKGTDGPRMGRRLAYELHLFDEAVPSLGSIQRDLRVLALSQAEPEELKLDADDATLERIIVRHLHSGKTESIRPVAGADGDVLDALARAVLAGVRSGAYIPRMVCGWHACGDCEYRPLCFAGEGIMRSLNPPMLSQIQSNQQHLVELRGLLAVHGGSRSLIAGWHKFAEWMAGTPGLSAEGALWFLDVLESEVS